MLGTDLVEYPLQEYVDEEPAAHIARLFLAPNHLGLLEPRQLGNQRLCGERIELFDAKKINIVGTAFFSLIVEIIVDLARAHNDAPYFVVTDKLDLLVRQQLCIVPQQTMKRRAVG